MGRVRDDLEIAIAMDDPCVFGSCVDDLRHDVDRSLASALHAAVRWGRVWALRALREWLVSARARFTIAAFDRLLLIDDIHRHEGRDRDELYAAAYDVLYMHEPDLDY